MGDFALLNGQISPYYHWNELQSENKRIISVYFTFAGYSKDKACGDPFHKRIEYLMGDFRQDVIYNLSNNNERRWRKMYLTVKEIAEFLELPEPYIENMIYQKKIRAIHDGEQFLVNKNQFDTHLNEMEKYKEIVMEILTQPIPEDIDVRDED